MPKADAGQEGDAESFNRRVHLSRIGVTAKFNTLVSATSLPPFVNQLHDDWLSCRDESSKMETMSTSILNPMHTLTPSLFFPAPTSNLHEFLIAKHDWTFGSWGESLEANPCRHD
jgi:hypothetical protein